jgi:5'-phosphate synthase pdxT subunit
MRIGVLALQGAFQAHLAVLRRLGVETQEVREARDLDGLAAVILPGGESTTMRLLGRERGLFPLLRSRIDSGMPVLGTCAGAILLAREVEGAETLETGVLDLQMLRNGFGSQRDSFVTSPPEARRRRVFIRAPRILHVGPGVEVLDALETNQEPVVVAAGNLTAATYHPELSGDPWLHERLVQQASLGPVV